VGFEPPTLLFSFPSEKCSLYYHIQYAFNFSIPPVDLCFFPIYGRKYSMKLKLLMANMWEFFLVFYFVPYKVNIPMHAGEFFMFLFCSIQS
jgi:hypothetical protein